MGRERERERGKREREFLNREREFLNRIVLYWSSFIVTICKGESAFAEERERQTERKKEMFSLERALIGFAAAVGDSVSRRPAMHVVGSLVAFGLLAVGILLVEVESDVFKLWVRCTTTSGEIFFFVCRPSKMMMFCVPFRLVSSNTTTTTSACVSPREEASSDATARLGEDRQTERARRCFLAVRAHLFFSERFQNHTLNWNHRKSYGFEKAYDFGTILLFSSLSTRRTTYSPIKSARKVSTMHTKIVLDYDSRRVEKKEGA